MRSLILVICSAAFMAPGVCSATAEDALNIVTSQMAVVRAITVAKDQPGLFDKPVIVSVESDKMGVYQVSFLRATSTRIEKEGRLPTSGLFTLSVSNERVVVTSGTWVISSRQPDEAGAAKAMACAAALEHLYAGKLASTELELRVSQTDEKAFSVQISRIPLTPGAHTGVEVGPDFKVKRVMPGA